MENITGNYDALQAAAEKATKGSWLNVGAWVENENDDLKDICDCRPNGNEDYEQALRDAAYIALANPDTILRLLLERSSAMEAAARSYTTSDTAAIRDVIYERRRQIEVERMETGNDDQYTDGELPEAAVAYALSAAGWDHDTAAQYWPSSWAGCWFKPITPRRDLVKAAALILAEIERIDRDPGNESHHNHLNGGSL
ncbi:ead/Ea22-like family protein [Burkholderia cenocepacia]|uniref:ead/Ea22-like family protein n=1 Tax=Burkholderia cenocepacia TaxID=95486 RepID=UPI002AB7C1A3|nr:ead/Ea22-like family protein [Burkholderia cenocepacia]